MKVVTVTGTSGSGKTTTIERIIEELKRRGYQVGSVKEIHYEAFAIDTPASNTHRHRAAGAELVAARGYHETDLLYPGKLPMKDVLRHYQGYDWVVLEGVEDLPVPGVICTEDKRNRFSICYAGKAFAQTQVHNGLPCFNALENAPALCDFLESQVLDYLECYDPDAPDSGMEIMLTVGEKELQLVPFVQKILRNAVLGVVRELEGYEEGQEVCVRLK